MARYKLRVPEAGTCLYGDGPETVVADSIEEARDLLEVFEVHSQIGVCQIVYAADVENGECHEDAEAGDTTVWYTPDDGRELGEDECRVWVVGPPSHGWSLSPLDPDPIDPLTVPVGCSLFLSDRGMSVRTVAEPREEDERCLVEVAPWNARGSDRRLRGFDVCLEAKHVHIHPMRDWPERFYRLEIAGETAEGTEEEMEWLRRWALSALNRRWRLDLYTAEGLHPDYGPVPDLRHELVLAEPHYTGGDEG